MSAATEYYDKTMKLLEAVRKDELPAVEKAAALCAEKIAAGGLVFMFGSGHSRMMCEEMTPRQGCYPGFVAMVELATSNHSAIIGNNGLRTALYLEKYEGYAEQLLSSFKFGPNDVLIVVSTSGIRPLIVELAMGAKARNMPVIGLVSVAHCTNSKSGHSSGKKLIDIADIILDNHCPPGDCILPLEGLEWMTGPTSTSTGAMLVNMLRCQTAAELLKRGVKPELLPSHQFVGNTSAEEQLERFYEAYRRSLAHLYQ